jgi:plasmid stability protein
MDATITRTQTSFRLNDGLIKKLRIEAKKHNRSLNNLVESILMAFVANKPNEETLAAMHEAETSNNLETLDLKNFRRFVDSL